MPHVAVAEETILKVHRAGDEIWFVAGASQPARSPLGVLDFPDGPEITPSTRVRMLGTWENAPLIARFAAFRDKRKLASIAVASPLVGRTSAERGNPKLMLFRMRNFDVPASLGGYHEVGPLDYLAYILATFFQYQLATPAQLDEALTNSPLWRYLSFIPHLDRTQLALLIATVRDPRWFLCQDRDSDGYDPRDYLKAPARDARKLAQFLGLDPKNMEAMYRGDDAKHARRARMVLATWKTTSAPPPESFRDDPRCFLWSRWRAHESAGKADLATSKLFVEYLRLCWLDAIYLSRFTRSEHGRPDGLFAPDQFFRPSEESAFREHIGPGR